MTQSLGYLKETSQTAVLTFISASFNNFGNVLVGANTAGGRITIEVRVFDGTGMPVSDALLEIWQANAAGRYNHPSDRQKMELDLDFRGWGRTGAEFETGIYRFETIKLGAVIGRHKRMMVPHVNFWIVARGINIGLHTRMYFADEQAANDADPVLNLIEQMERRSTLIAKHSQNGDRVTYAFDIVLQGDNETVFLDV